MTISLVMRKSNKKNKMEVRNVLGWMTPRKINYSKDFVLFVRNRNVPIFVWAFANAHSMRNAVRRSNKRGFRPMITIQEN